MAAAAKRRQQCAAYEFGYGRPPAAHRFRKGASGNPSGRRRTDTRTLPSAEMKEAFLKAARQPLTMTVDGRQVTTTRGEAAIHRLIAEALKGNMRALKMFLEHMRVYAAEEEAAAAHPTHEEALQMLLDEPPEPQNIVVTFVKSGDKDESGSDR